MSTQTATREHPIIFSGEMIRAILAGRKTQTRRVIKPQPGEHLKLDCVLPQGEGPNDPYAAVRFIDSRNSRDVTSWGCPYGQPGDRLWVREEWTQYDLDWRYVDKPDKGFRDCPRMYRADRWGDEPWRIKGWRRAMFMPKWASRITLEITGVRVERLQAITEEDAIAEGMHEFKADGKSFGFGYNPQGTPGAMVNDTAIGAFALLWESINAKKAPWDSDPFVWVISFKRIKP